LFPVVALGDMGTVITITVKFMSIARQRAGVSAAEFTSHESKLRLMLKEIAEAYRITNIILTEGGEVRPWARVLVNGRSHVFVGGLDTELHNGDCVALVYPYAENF
jgi:molybdopterin converting factor small subunit